MRFGQDKIISEHYHKSGVQPSRTDFFQEVGRISRKAINVGGIDPLTGKDYILQIHFLSEFHCRGNSLKGNRFSIF